MYRKEPPYSKIFIYHEIYSLYKKHSTKIQRNRGYFNVSALVSARRSGLTAVDFFTFMANA